MANFQKHIEVATITSGIASTSLLGAGIINSFESVLLWVAGTFGGILPDIDSDDSVPIKIVFSIITVLAVLSALAQLNFSVSTLEIWIFIFIIYLVVNHLVRPLFESFTVHRGIFHSLLAAVFSGLLTTVIAYQFTTISSLTSWLTGFFVFFGYCVHLTLDEIYSVDFMNVRVKRSFGSALKLFEYRDYKTSAIMLVGALGLVALTPDGDGFQRLLASSEGFNLIRTNFLP